MMNSYLLAAARRAVFLDSSDARNSALRAAAKRGIITVAIFLTGCMTPKYGVERELTITDGTHPVWAVAPAINLSGEKSVDPVLQADLLVRQLGEVNNLTVIPVNRVVAVYAALRITKVESEEQAAIVCQQLGCDALLVPTITLYNPYDPPKVGISLQLLNGPGKGPVSNIDPRELSRRATPADDEILPTHPNFNQVVGMYDAEDGSTRAALLAYAKGRHDPNSNFGDRMYFLDTDKFCSFVYFTLIEQLLGDSCKPVVPPANDVQANDMKPAVVSTDN
jgi:hypothetical protein